MKIQSEILGTCAEAVDGVLTRVKEKAEGKAQKRASGRMRSTSTPTSSALTATTARPPECDALKRGAWPWWLGSSIGFPYSP